MSSANCEFERLPRIYEPKVYILELYPNANDFTFHGKVTICMSLTIPTNSITLNAKKIEILSAKIGHSALKSELIGSPSQFHFPICLFPISSHEDNCV